MKAMVWRIVADMEKVNRAVWLEVAIGLREGRSGNDKKRLEHV